MWIIHTDKNNSRVIEFIDENLVENFWNRNFISVIVKEDILRYPISIVKLKNSVGSRVNVQGNVAIRC